MQTSKGIPSRPPFVHCLLQIQMHEAAQSCVAISFLFALFTAIFHPMTLDSNSIQVSRMKCPEDQDGRGSGQSEERIHRAIMLATFVPNNWALALDIFLTFHFGFNIVCMCFLLGVTSDLFWKQVACDFKKRQNQTGCFQIHTRSMSTTTPKLAPLCWQCHQAGYWVVSKVHLYPEIITQTQWKFPIAFKVLHSVYLVVRQIEQALPTSFSFLAACFYHKADSH